MKEQYRRAFRKNLEKRRKQAGLRKQDFAKALGISGAYLSQLLSGKRCGAEKMFDIADKLHVPICELLDLHKKEPSDKY